MDDRLAFALRFAGMDWRLFPQDRNKVPCIKGWPEKATTDPEQIRSWAKQFPKANFATTPNKNQIILDIDTKNGLPGLKSLEGLQRDVDLPATLTTRTPSGGLHQYLVIPRYLVLPGERGKIRNGPLEGYPGIEVKTMGGCITLPGSFYVDGREYVLEKDLPAAEAPEALVKLLLQSRSSTRKSTKTAPEETVSSGKRNSVLTSIAGTMRHRGMSEEEILRALLIENDKRCDPPLQEKEIRGIAESVGRYEPGGGDFHRSDTGNAERFVARYGAEIRYCDEWGKWLIWDGRRWERDGMRLIRRFAKNTVRGMYNQASLIEDDVERKSLVKYALGSEAMIKIKNMIEGATSEPGIPVRTQDLDADSMLLNVENGTIDLRSGELRSHRQEDLITKLAPLPYNPDADCPLWLDFLNLIMMGRTELVDFLQKAVGYSLTGDTSEDVFFFLYGPTAENGKTTFLNTIHYLLGDYACRSQIETFLATYHDNIPNDLAALHGARFVSAVEPQKGRRFNEARLKALTGGEPMQARFMRAEFFEFQPQLKIWISSNNRPNITDTTRGMWRRVRAIPFDYRIPEKDQDKHFEERLRVEWPGILNWALAGCAAWLKDGLETPEAVVTATTEYKDDMDVLSDFIAERLIKDPAAKLQSSLLYDDYKAYSEGIGEKKPWSMPVFVREMKERGFKKKKLPEGMFWIGIGLK